MTKAKAKKQTIQSPMLLDESQNEALNAAARKLDRTRAAIIRQLLVRYLPQMLRDEAVEAYQPLVAATSTEEGKRKLAIQDQLITSIRNREVKCPRCDKSDSVSLVPRQASPLALIVDQRVDWQLFVFDLHCSFCNVRWKFWPDRAAAEAEAAAKRMEEKQPASYTLKVRDTDSVQVG